MPVRKSMHPFGQSFQLKLKAIAISGIIIFLSVFVGYSQVRADDVASAPAVETYNKAVRLYQAKHWDSAREYFHQYLAEYSDTPLYVTCLYYLAFCYQQMGDTKQAIVLYHKVIDMAIGADAFWGDMSQRRLMDLGEDQ